MELMIRQCFYKKKQLRIFSLFLSVLFIDTHFKRLIIVSFSAKECMALLMQFLDFISKVSVARSDHKSI